MNRHSLTMCGTSLKLLNCLKWTACYQFTRLMLLDIDITQGPFWPIELCDQAIFPNSKDFHSRFCGWNLLDLFCYRNFKTVGCKLHRTTPGVWVGCAFGVPIGSCHTGYKASCIEFYLNVVIHLSQLSSGSNPLTTNSAQDLNAAWQHTFLQLFTYWNGW